MQVGRRRQESGLMVVFAVWACIDDVAGCVRVRACCVDGSVKMRCDAVVVCWAPTK